MTVLETLLQHKGSLTTALRQHGELKIQVIKQKFDPASNYFIREVNLLVDNQPWVMARIVIPTATYIRFKEILDNLGEHSIGEALLYKYPFKRSDFQYNIINDSRSRHSVFALENYRVLVTEIFCCN